MLLRRYRRQLFTTTGAFTWYRPDGVTSVDVTVVGGGAGGGSVPLANNGGAGGGGSGWREVVQGFSVSGDVTGVVGAGGAGGTAARDDANCTVYQGIAYFIDTAAVGGDVGKNVQALPGGAGWQSGTTIVAVNTTSRTDNTITLTTGQTTFTDASAVSGDVGCIVTDTLSAFAVGTVVTAVNTSTHVVTVNRAIAGSGGTANVTLHPTVQTSTTAYVWGQPSPLIVGGRVDASCGTTFGSATVTDASILARDVGKTVTGAGIPASTFVGTVTAGVSFLLSSSATSQVNVTATATGNPVSLTLGGGGTERTDTPPPVMEIQGGTTNVVDTAAVAGDAGKAITGTGIARGTTISSVAATVGYTLNQNGLGSSDGSFNCTVAVGLAGTGTNGTDSSFGALVAKGGGGGGAGGQYAYAKNGNSSGPSTGGNAIIGYLDSGGFGTATVGAGGGGGGGSGGGAPYLGGGTKAGGCTGGSYGAGGRSDNSNVQFANGAGGGGSGGAGGVYPRQDDACTSTNASPTVTDTKTVLADIGQPFDDAAGYTFDNSFVGPVTYGVSFNASSTNPTYTAKNALVAYSGNLIIQIGWSQNGGTGGSRIPQPGGGGGNGPSPSSAGFGCGGVGVIGGLANAQNGSNWIQMLDALPGSGAGGGAGLGTAGGAGAAGYVAVGWWEDL